MSSFLFFVLRILCFLIIFKSSSVSQSIYVCKAKKKAKSISLYNNIHFFFSAAFIKAMTFFWKKMPALYSRCSYENELPYMLGIISKLSLLPHCILCVSFYFHCVSMFELNEFREPLISSGFTSFTLDCLVFISLQCLQ